MDKKKPNAECAFVAKIPNSPEGRDALAAFRKYANRDAYNVVVRFSGPRRRENPISTLKQDATHFRVYFNSKGELWQDRRIAELREEKWQLESANRKLALRPSVAPLESEIASLRSRNDILADNISEMQAENHRLHVRVQQLNAQCDRFAEKNILAERKLDAIKLIIGS